MQFSIGTYAAALCLTVTYTDAVCAQQTGMKSLAATVIETNPEIEAQRAAVAALEARVSAARGGYLPTIEVNGLVQRRRLNIRGGVDNDSTFTAGQAGIEARQTFFDGFRTQNAVGVANAELGAGRATLDATVSEVLLDLLRAASDVRRDRQVRQYAQLQFNAISEQLRGTSRRLTFGEATRTDESQAKARLATSSAGMLSTQEDFDVSASAFEAVSGQSAATVPPLPELAPLPGSIEEAQSIARTSSPRLRSAQNTAEAARRGVSFARGALAPELDIVGGYDYLTGGVANLFTGSLPDDRSALFGGLQLRVPIFQGGREYAEIRRAKAIGSQRLAQVAQVERLVVQEVGTAWARWTSATAIIGAARDAVTANEQAADGVGKEALGGSRTVLDVLDAQNELLGARVAFERAVRNEYVARASVLASIGRLDEKAILDAR